MKNKKLPKPECSLGYTDDQLDQILGQRRQEFNKWMSGQTVALCDGREYDYATGGYIPTGKAHGSATYPQDLQRFLDGRPIID